MMIASKIEKLVTNVKGAIHVGANIGEERNWYSGLGFSPVIWFEPNKELFPLLVDNLCLYPNHYAFNLGVHDSLKRATLHISNNDGQSSSILPLGTHKQYHPDVHYIREESVKLCRLDEFIPQLGYSFDQFNFLNVDVQGVELNVIKSLGKCLFKFDYLYVEVNEEELYKGCSFISEIDYYVSIFGFSRVITKMTKAHWGDAFYIKTKVN